jgi:hypothetical protein
MAANIDDTRPDHDYSAAHRRSDDTDIGLLLQAAETIDVYVECVSNLTDERDEARREVARLLDVETGHRIAIANLTAERDDARRIACEVLAAGDDEEASEYAKLRNWDFFAHTDGASAPEIPDNSREANQ